MSSLNGSKVIQNASLLLIASLLLCAIILGIFLLSNYIFGTDSITNRTVHSQLKREVLIDDKIVSKKIERVGFSDLDITLKYQPSETEITKLLSTNPIKLCKKYPERCKDWCKTKSSEHVWGINYSQLHPQHFASIYVNKQTNAAEVNIFIE